MKVSRLVLFSSKRDTTKRKKELESILQNPNVFGNGKRTQLPERVSLLRRGFPISLHSIQINSF